MNVGGGGARNKEFNLPASVSAIRATDEGVVSAHARILVMAGGNRVEGRGSCMVCV
jgi:hypothetical protein